MNNQYLFENSRFQILFMGAVSSDFISVCRWPAKKVIFSHKLSIKRPKNI